LQIYSFILHIASSPWQVGKIIYVPLKSWEYTSNPYPLDIETYLVKGEIKELIMHNKKAHYSVYWEAFDETTPHDFMWFCTWPRVTVGKHNVVLTRKDVLETEVDEEDTEEGLVDSSIDDKEISESQDVGIKTSGVKGKRRNSRTSRPSQRRKRSDSSDDSEFENEICDEENSEDEDYTGDKFNLADWFDGADVELEEEPVFDEGTERIGRTRGLNRYKDLDEIDILLQLSTEFLHHVVDMYNLKLAQDKEFGSPDCQRDPLTVDEMLKYYAIAHYRSVVRLHRLDLYWDKIYQRKMMVTIPDFNEFMTRRRYFEIRKHLRFEDYSRLDIDETDKAWKVRKIFQIVQKSLQQCNKTPGQELSADEGMGRGTSKRNPLLHNVPNKPIDTGFKFYILVDFATKVIINIELDDKSINAENSKDYAYGAYGRRIMQLVDPLPGSNYNVYTDNLYGNYSLTTALRTRAKGRINTVTTVRKNKLPSDFSIKFAGKAPKPSRNNPRGTLKVAHHRDNGIHMYGWMDNGAVYFMDSTQRGSEMVQIQRRIGGAFQYFQVPQAIKKYNQYMGGVDVFDQVRTGPYGTDTEGRTNKWTIRFHEIMWSFLVAQSYNIYRHLHKEDDKALDHHDFASNLAILLIQKPWDRTYLRDFRMSAGQAVRGHKIKQTAPHSRFGMRDKRRLPGRCRHCPNKNNDGRKNNRETTFWCIKCCVFLHPECFESWHENPENYECVVKHHQLQSMAPDYVSDDDEV